MLDDVPELTALHRANREFLAPWEPIREDEFFSEVGQAAIVRADLDLYDEGRKLPRVIVDDAGRIVGKVTLNGIVRASSFLSCAMGYWVSESENGKGLATRAVGEVVRHAFGELELHRVQAEVMPRNAGSQRVLERNGFERFGMAPGYLRIAGRWEDHIMYQALNPAV